jgi:hypothetical protein
LMGWVSLWTVENIWKCSMIYDHGFWVDFCEIWLKYLHVKTDWVGLLDVRCLRCCLILIDPGQKTAVRVAVGQ